MSKKERLPWFKMYPEAWLEDTRDLTPEQRGVYFDCLCLIYKYDRALPKNDAWMAHELHVNAKVWRRVRDGLLTLGLLVENPDGYMNKRAASELEERVATRLQRSSNAVARELQRSSAPELPLDFNEARGRLRPQKGPHARALARVEIVEEDKKEVAAASAAPPGWKILADKLYEAGGSAINPGAGGFLNLSTPQWWLEKGCCLERDVLPTIRDICQRKRHDKIISWSYFTEAVTAAKIKREQPLPEVDPRQERGNRRSAKAQANAAMAAIFEQGA